MVPKRQPRLRYFCLNLALLLRRPKPFTPALWPLTTSPAPIATSPVYTFTIPNKRQRFFYIIRHHFQRRVESDHRRVFCLLYFRYQPIYHRIPPFLPRSCKALSHILSCRRTAYFFLWRQILPGRSGKIPKRQLQRDPLLSPVR